MVLLICKDTCVEVIVGYLYRCVIIREWNSLLYTSIGYMWVCVSCVSIICTRTCLRCLYRCVIYTFSGIFVVDIVVFVYIGVFDE